MFIFSKGEVYLHDSKVATAESIMTWLKRCAEKKLHPICESGFRFCVSKVCYFIRKMKVYFIDQNYYALLKQNFST